MTARKPTTPLDVACFDCLARPDAACRWVDGSVGRVLTDYHPAREKAALKRECAELRHENMCDACAGTGTPTSGPGCMCGGSGKMSDAAHYLRERYAEQHVRADCLLSLLNEVERSVPWVAPDREFDDRWAHLVNRIRAVLAENKTVRSDTAYVPHREEAELECSGCKDATGQMIGPCEDGRMHRSWCRTGIRELRRRTGSPMDDLVCAPMVPKLRARR